jgi:hypothetical protein
LAGGIGIVSAVGSFVLLLKPVSVISPSVNLNPRDAFATQFAIKNEGRVPVFDVNFGCKILKITGPIQVTDMESGSNSSQPPVSILWPGRTATRNCATSWRGFPMTSLSLDVTAAYRWPIYFFSSTATGHFEGRQGAAGYFLVPDVER